MVMVLVDSTTTARISVTSLFFFLEIDLLASVDKQWEAARYQLVYQYCHIEGVGF